MAAINVNEWFRNADSPTGDIARMLMEFDSRGMVPEAMREALYKHASNALGTLPSCISATATAMASALAGGCGLGNEDTESVSWAIAGMAESIRSMRELEYQFGPNNRFRTKEGQAK